MAIVTARTFALLAALGLLAAIGQVVGLNWGPAGEVAGSVFAGTITLLGWRLFAPEFHKVYLLPIAAIAASLVGMLLGVAGSTLDPAQARWAIAFLAALPTGLPVLWLRVRGPRCHFCRHALRRILSFSCPRCDLIACEHCWDFDRGRCHLCAANQALLFPVDSAWWERRFGSQVYEGRCALCLRTPDWKVSHWACPSCGHTHCRSCWDDNNGQCSRCAWSFASTPANAAEYPAAGSEQSDWLEEEEERSAQIPDAVRHGSR